MATINRSKIVKRTWADASVAKARAKKQKVRVAGYTYRSTGAAFKALGINIINGQKIAFRVALKAAGRKTYIDPATKLRYVFTTVD